MGVKRREFIISSAAGMAAAALPARASPERPARLPYRHIDRNRCIGCGRCVPLCPMGAITPDEKSSINPDECAECGVCLRSGVRPAEEIIVLAMAPGEYKDKEGPREAMSELALKMLDHEPHLWMSHNFPALDIQRLGSLQTLIRWMHKIRPKATQRLLFREVASRSSVITAIYTNHENVVALLKDMKGRWLHRNRRRDIPYPRCFPACSKTCVNAAEERKPPSTLTSTRSEYSGKPRACPGGSTSG